MARRKRSDQHIGVGLTSKQMKRKKPINLDLMRDIDPLTENQKLLYRFEKLKMCLYHHKNSNIFQRLNKLIIKKWNMYKIIKLLIQTKIFVQYNLHLHQKSKMEKMLL